MMGRKGAGEHDRSQRPPANQERAVEVGGGECAERREVVHTAASANEAGDRLDAGDHGIVRLIDMLGQSPASSSCCSARSIARVRPAGLRTLLVTSNPDARAA